MMVDENLISPSGHMQNQCIYFLSTERLALEQWPSRRGSTSCDVPRTVYIKPCKVTLWIIHHHKAQGAPLSFLCEILATNQLTSQRKEISREEDATSVPQAQTRNLQESRQSMAVFFVMSTFVVMGVTTFTTVGL